MNVALRAVHDALAPRGEQLATTWTSLIAKIGDCTGPGGRVDAAALRTILRAIGCGGTAAEWLTNLELLGVVDRQGRLHPQRAQSVATALDLAADSFSVMGSQRFWAPVATLPSELRPLLRPPPLRQTAGVLLDMIDHAAEKTQLAAPFVDPHAVAFLAESLLGAARRSVDVTVITSLGQGVHFAELSRRWSADHEARGRLRVTEVQTHLSSLGSHAKVIVVDSRRGYVGSANLTAAGLGRHVEIGVELAGPQVAELTAVLAALERAGSTVLTAGR